MQNVSSEYTLKNERLEKAQQQFTELFIKAPAMIAILKGRELIYEMANPDYLKLVGKKDIIGKTVRTVLPELESQGFLKLLENVYNTGLSFEAEEMLVKIASEDNEGQKDNYLNLVYQAYKNIEGDIEGIFFFANNITEQVEARKKLEESEKRYRQFVETAQEGIWMIDKNNQTTFVNEKLCDILEYTCAEMIGKPNTFFMDEEGKEIATNADNTRTLGMKEKVDMPLFTKTRKKVWVTLSGSTVLDENGEYNGGLAMVTDITERRKAEEKLVQSEELFRTLIENTNDAIVMYDRNLVTIYGSPAVTKMLGYDDQDKLDKSFDAVMHPDDEPKKKRHIQEVLENPGKSCPFELRALHKAGHYIWIEGVTINLLDNKNINAIVSNFRCVTERKHAEEQLLKSNFRYKLATTATSNAIWDWDLTTGETCWSEGYKLTFGYDMVDIPENFISWTSKIFTPDFERVYEGILKMISGYSGVYWEDEYRFIKADGTIAYVYNRGNLVFGQNNKPVRFVGAMQDITLRKEIETERELLIKELMKSNADLKQFSYITSHNLRSPLANISAILSMIDYPALDASNREMIEMLKASCGHLNATINDLSNILIIKNNNNVEITSINLDTLLNELKPIFLADLNNIGASIFTDFQVPQLSFNKTYLESIFQNLISNAIKYRSPNRKLIVHILSRKDQNGNCRITFSDNGIGIDMKRHKDKVFGLYQRFHNEIEGQGLGLFIIKSQITSLGGNIEIESEVDKGTSFIITFNKNC